MSDDPARFVRVNTAIAAPPLAPEIRLHLATEITPIWQATEDDLAESGLQPPFWAFPWPGGQALARHLLDNPATVAGKHVLDFAAGGGIAAIAAAMAGAARVTANDIDVYAVAAIELNATLNNVVLETATDDLTGNANPGWDVVVAGDVCYERPMAERAMGWLRDLAGAGTLVLMGDPGRNFLPADGLEEIARYDVPTSIELEDRETRTAIVWRVLP